MKLVTRDELARRHLRRAQYVACSDAFLDVRLPGSMPKENYSMIGPGVTQNAEQFVNLREPHGFNVGAAGVPPGVTNNLHLHFTAEVFVCLNARWRLQWGVDGTDGEATLEPGDVICMPPWIFRGFTNIGDEHGFLLTVLGGDDTGGILWSPKVLARAAATGMYLGRDNEVIDVGEGGVPPPADALMPPLAADRLGVIEPWSADALLARCVRRGARDFRVATLDAMRPGHAWQLAPVIGHGLTQRLGHRPGVCEPQGFSVEWVRVPAGASSAPFVLDEAAVLVHVAGPLAVRFNDGADALDASLGAWDTLSMPAGSLRRWVNEGTEDAEALLVVAGDHRKLPRFGAYVVAEAARLDVALDAGGHLAPRSVLPSTHRRDDAA